MPAGVDISSFAERASDPNGRSKDGSLKPKTVEELLAMDDVDSVTVLIA
jgi:hypothetical protein